MVESERQIALRTLDLQKRGRDYGLVEIPSYQSWSERKLQEGVSPAFIAHLDATCMFLLPEEFGNVDESVYEELLEDIASQYGGN